MENLDPPPPPPPQTNMAKWQVFALRAASSLIWGGGVGWGFAVPFYFVQDCSNLLFSVCLLLFMCRKVTQYSELAFVESNNL